MNLKTFQYSLLKYCPSYALGEQVNIAILFFFEEEGILQFHFPNALSRIKGLFPNTDIHVLKNYLQHLKSKIDLLSTDTETLKNASFNELIEQHILTPDSNSLYFAPIKAAQYPSVSQALEHYKETYFSVYRTKDTKRKKRNLEPIRNSENLISQKDVLISLLDHKKDEGHFQTAFDILLNKALHGHREKLAFFKPNPIVANNISSTKFDYAWQNGTTNLVKFINFDLGSKTQLQDTSFRWYGELSQLEEQAKNQNLKFDLILTKPQNEAILPSYNNAVKILDKIKANKELVEYKALERYIHKAVEAVKPFTNQALLNNPK